MSLFLTAIGRARPPSTPAGSETYQQLVQALSPDWYLPLSETSGTNANDASTTGTHDGTYVNSPQLGVDPIAQDDTGGKSVGLFEASSTPHITVASRPLTSASFTIHVLAQLDALSKSKHTLITSGGGTNPGDFELAVRTNGQPWAWSEDGTVWNCFGAEGQVPQGKAVSIVYQRQSSTTSWSQRLHVDGALVKEDSTPRTWSAPPDQAWYIGAWSSLADPVDGLIAHVAGWNSLLTPTQISSLARAKSVAWAEDVDAGSVQVGGTLPLNTETIPGVHGRTPFTATAGNTAGNTATTSESGGTITITGAAQVTNGTFTYSFTDANGNTSQTRTVTVDVTAAAAGLSLPDPLVAFQPARVRVTTIPTWPAGRTPKEVVTQGSHAHGFVRRGWKPDDNDGTYMDFQAGWRKTTGPGVIRVKLDDNSEIDLNYTVNHSIPAGTQRWLDRSLTTGANDGSSEANAWRTWSAAIRGVGTNQVLIVRARAGTAADGLLNSVYPINENAHNSGTSPISTASGVKVVAHPDDLAAGRRPRVHVQGGTFARYADELNGGHWERKRPDGSDGALGGSHGSIWRTTQVIGGDKKNVGISYRTTAGTLMRCYTYTQTPAPGVSTPNGVLRLQDTAYVRISSRHQPLYMGPGCYLHTDGRLYIRLTPLSNGIGARQVNPSAGQGSNPPWNWAQYAPQNTDPNQCQLYISSSNQYLGEHTVPQTGTNYCARFHGTTNWIIENIDFVGGGNTIELSLGSGHTLRGCRELGWATSNMNDQDDVVSRRHNAIEMKDATGIVCDRCEFWGGQPPWYGWEENKSHWGGYPNPAGGVLYQITNAGTGSILLRHCHVYAYSFLCRRGGVPGNFKAHHTTLEHVGMDGSLATDTPTEGVEILRSKLLSSSIGGWLGGSERGYLRMGYNLIVNVRGLAHDTAYWDSGLAQANQFCPLKIALTHGGLFDAQRVFWYNNTTAGGNSSQRMGTKTNIGGNLSDVARDGAGGWVFPHYSNHELREWWSRNNLVTAWWIGGMPSLANTRAPAWGDSHAAVVLHQNHIGFRVTLDAYSANYNVYWRDPNIPTITSQNTSDSANTHVTTVNSGGTESERTTISSVRTDTGQEANGDILDPKFAGVWDYTKLDAVIYGNAFWCLTAASPSKLKTGGDGTDRSWPDVDFGSVGTYRGNAFIGCMDPNAGAVEQQVGPLGPMPSDL